MKKALALVLALVMAFALVACGGTPAPVSENPVSEPAAEEPAGISGEITIVSNKIEIDAALKEYAATFEEQTGVKVNVKSFGGETPYAPAFTAMLNSGEEPEIYVIEGKSGYEDAVAGGRVMDLSGEPWVADTDVAYKDPDGKVVGFPVAVEGWGLGYNKALLAKAGIDPATLTNYAAIEAAFKAIDAKKAELGIDGVVSMVAGEGMTWVTGLHGVNAYLTLGLPYADSRLYIDKLLAGEVDTARLEKFARYYDLLFKYSIKNTLTNGGYDQQLGDFATGKTVFIHQGNWTDPTFAGLEVDMEMGYVPHAYLDEDTDGIFVAAPSFYLVNPKAANTDAAKAFLTAMATTPEGHDYMVNKAGMVPAFKSCTLQPAGQLSRAVQEWSATGKIYNWMQNDMPSGFGMETLGPVFGQLAAGKIDQAKFVQLFTEAVATLKA